MCLWLELQCMSGILGTRGPWTSPGVCWSVALAVEAWTRGLFCSRVLEPHFRLDKGTWENRLTEIKPPVPPITTASEPLPCLGGKQGGRSPQYRTVVPWH